MNEIDKNIEGYNENGICVGCLNYNRNMFYADEVKECFRLLGSIDVPEGRTVQVCWECLAAIQTVSRFRAQVIKAFAVLKDYSRKHEYLESPSALTKHAATRLSSHVVSITSTQWSVKQSGDSGEAQRTEEDRLAASEEARLPENEVKVEVEVMDLVADPLAGFESEDEDGARTQDEDEDGARAQDEDEDGARAQAEDEAKIRGLARQLRAGGGRKQASNSFNDLSSLLRSAIGSEDLLDLKQQEAPLIDLEALTQRQSLNRSQVWDSPLPLRQDVLLTPADSSTPNSLRHQDNQVATLCEATPQGRALLKACLRASKTGPLETKLRNQLCAYLITQQTPAGETVKLPQNHHLLQMSHDIARLCAAESAALYYCPSIARGKFTSKKNTSGWLVNARNNRRKTLVSLGFLEPPAKRLRPCSTDTAGPPQSPSAHTAIDLSHLEAGEIDSVQSAIDQLKGNIAGIPWPTIEQLWSETVKARLYACYHETGKVQEYLNTYPVLKGPEGWRLLVKDFEALYSDAADGLAACMELAPKIISHAQNKAQSLKDKFVVATIKKITEQCMGDDDYVKLTGAVILLGCLYKISPAASRTGGTGSRPEVLKRLVSFVPSENDVIGEIQKHAAATRGSFQPFLIAVGQPYNIIASVFFCLTESTFWKFESFPEALDAGFKIMHAVACPYPSSCYSIWLAIQIAFYHIKTIYDDCSRSLKQLLLDLGLASTLQPYLALK